MHIFELLQRVALLASAFFPQGRCSISSNSGSGSSGGGSGRSGAGGGKIFFTTVVQLEEMPEETVLHLFHFLAFPLSLFCIWFFASLIIHPHIFINITLIIVYSSFKHCLIFPQPFRPPAWQEPFRPCQIQQGARAVFQVFCPMSLWVNPSHDVLSDFASDSDRFSLICLSSGATFVSDDLVVLHSMQMF